MNYIPIALTALSTIIFIISERVKPKGMRKFGVYDIIASLCAIGLTVGLIWTLLANGFISAFVCLIVVMVVAGMLMPIRK